MSNKDLFFEREIIAAAGVSSVEDARSGWQWVGGGFHTSVDHCQLCHTPIKHFASIKHEQTGVILTIGFDCLTKLEKFQQDGKIEPVREVLRRKYLNYINRSIGDRKVVAAMSKWIRQTMPGKVRIIGKLETPLWGNEALLRGIVHPDDANAWAKRANEIYLAKHQKSP